MRKLIIFIPLILYILVVYRPFLFQGYLPIPADTIVGLYHPWRDFFVGYFPNGIPFKNSLITDAVRQEYPWRQLAMTEIFSGKWPSWNPYSFTGYPLAANLQSAPFYPLNVLYLVKNFPLVWSIQIALQTILGAIFMGLFLRSRKLTQEAVVLGTLAWIGSGFIISWLETNTVVSAAIWLPLALYALNRRSGLLLVIALSCSFFAGHLQTTMYVFAAAFGYAIWERRTKVFIGGVLITLILTAFSWWSAVKFIQLSGREFDQLVWQKPDWFLPWQNLIQFVAPDFFGNPATLNYFGIWNYGEFVGYIGLTALFFSFLAIFVKNWYRNFFTWLLLGSLILALPNPISAIPYQFKIPLIASSQPSRIIVLVGLALAVLAAQGMNQLARKDLSWRKIWGMLGGGAVVYAILWLVAIKWHLAVSRSNLILPSVLFMATSVLVVVARRFDNYKKWILIAILLLAVFDSARFADKFLPFTPREWLYPKTKMLTFLADQQKNEVFRVISMEDRIVPDNFLVAYKIQTPSGYDPLYPLRYGEFIAAMERDKPNIQPPFHYNRSITPRQTARKLYALLNVKYVFSPFELFDPIYKKVFQEGETRLYELTNYLPRTFFVQEVLPATDKTDSIMKMFAPDFDPAKVAVEEGEGPAGNFGVGSVVIKKYEPDEVIIETSNSKEGFLVLLDAYYPSWRASVDGQLTKIYITDFAFRGILVPTGVHIVRFEI